MKETTYFKLKKPDGTDVVNVGDFNENADIIDEELNKRPIKTGEAGNMTVAATQASTRANLKSGESLKVSVGKIMKWFSDLAAGASSTLIGTNLVANRAIVSDVNGKIAVSPVTATELGHLDGTKSNIQEQINTVKSSVNTTGDTIVVEEAEIGTSWCSVEATMIFQKLSDNIGNLHISYRIVSKQETTSDEFLNKFSINDAFPNIEFNWSIMAPYQTRVIFAHQFINNPSDTLEIIGACSSNTEMGETGIKMGNDSNGRYLALTPRSGSSLTLDKPVFQVGSYGHIDVFGIQYATKT